jgi:hypothetical protein
VNLVLFVAILLAKENQEVKGGEKSMSNQQAMRELTDRFMSDADFREEMKQDPEGAAERSGLQLDDEDKQSLKSIDWSGSDEELKERVSKRIVC